MARFPDSRIAAARRAFPSAFARRIGVARSRDSDIRSTRSLAAYSGGTVWASHPLRVAAGASVSCRTDYTCKPGKTAVGLPDVVVFA